MTATFPNSTLNTIRKSPVIGIKAGKAPHRVIAVWAVVVKNRVFIRSWSHKERSWFHAFRNDRVGELHLGTRKVRVRPVFVRSAKLKDEVSKAYAQKYHTPGSVRFVRDMSRMRSRNTTTELAPLR